MSEVYAVRQDEVIRFGCPYCGYRSGYMTINCGNAGVISCGECNKPYVMVHESLTQSPIAVGGVNPEVVKHPRYGIVSHGKPDNPPEYGEHFHSRGIGYEDCGGCFVCGKQQNRIDNNIAAFVQTKVAGERVVAMFTQGARLDYREYEPDRVQVKIGACNLHLPNLQLLNEETSIDGIITQEMVDAVLDL